MRRREYFPAARKILQEDRSILKPAPSQRPFIRHNARRDSRSARQRPNISTPRRSHARRPTTPARHAPGRSRTTPTAEHEENALGRCGLTAAHTQAPLYRCEVGRTRPSPMRSAGSAVCTAGRQPAAFGRCCVVRASPASRQSLYRVSLALRRAARHPAYLLAPPRESTPRRSLAAPMLASMLRSGLRRRHPCRRTRIPGAGRSKPHCRDPR